MFPGKRTLWRLALSGCQLLFVLLGVSVVCFILVDVSPLDPVRLFAGEVGYQNMSAEALDRLRAYFGQGTPLPLRYGHWLKDFVQGNMGMSLIYRAPVASVIGVRFMNTLGLMLAAWISSGLLGFVLGIIAAVYRDKALDTVIKTYSFVLSSAPVFWLALLVLMVFAVQLKLFPIGLSVPLGLEASKVTFLDTLRHLVLPGLTLSITGIASITLHTREKMIDILEEDYVLFARSRGVKTLPLVFRHGLRNVLLPGITLQFAQISEIFGGSVLVEQVFSYPGLGQAAVKAGLSGDAPLLLGIAMISAVLVFGGNCAANILYRVVDPRIRRGGSL